MEVCVYQIYIEEGVYYDFSYLFQEKISEHFTSFLKDANFEKCTYVDFDLSIVVSAKRNIDAVKLKGPSIYDDKKEIEYVIYLPFIEVKNGYEALLDFLFDGFKSVIEELQVVYSVDSLEMIIDTWKTKLIHGSEMFDRMI